MALDELAKQMIKTLISELQAVTDEARIDHKTRLQALKEARSLVISLLPKMTPEDRKKFSDAMTQELNEKLKEASLQEQILRSLPDKP